MEIAHLAWQGMKVFTLPTSPSAGTRLCFEMAHLGEVGSGNSGGQRRGKGPLDILGKLLLVHP